MDSPFSQANLSPEVGAELMEALGLDALSIRSPETFKKYLAVAQYFGKFQDAGMVARTVARNTSLKDKLDKVYEYVHLRSSLDAIRREKNELPTPDIITNDTEENRARREELDTHEHMLLGELERYER